MRRKGYNLRVSKTIVEVKVDEPTWKLLQAKGYIPAEYKYESHQFYVVPGRIILPGRTRPRLALETNRTWKHDGSKVYARPVKIDGWSRTNAVYIGDRYYWYEWPNFYSAPVSSRGF